MCWPRKLKPLSPLGCVFPPEGRSGSCTQGKMQKVSSLKLENRLPNHSWPCVASVNQFKDVKSRESHYDYSFLASKKIVNCWFLVLFQRPSYGSFLTHFHVFFVQARTCLSCWSRPPLQETLQHPVSNGP